MKDPLKKYQEDNIVPEIRKQMADEFQKVSDDIRSGKTSLEDMEKMSGWNQSLFGRFYLWISSIRKSIGDKK